jgi:hypothetical protein
MADTPKEYRSATIDDIDPSNFEDWEHPTLMRRSEKPATIEDAMILIYQILHLEHSDIVFTPAYPDYLVDSLLIRDTEDAPQMPDKTIAWSVIRMSPGSTSGNKFGARKELTPRLRETSIPNNEEVALGLEVPETEIVTYGQRFESIIQFDCFAKTNFEAERLVTEFMKTMTLHVGTLKKYGVSRWYFERRLRDEFLLKFRNGIIARSVQYYIMSEEVTYELVEKLKSIRIALEELRSQDSYPDWATRVKERIKETT